MRARCLGSLKRVLTRMALSNISPFLPPTCGGPRPWWEGAIFSDVSVGCEVERERRCRGG